ncbi:MAG: hypothetical protein LUG18_07155 [Candidatus Azobacteroides sp.]|nr:hypothetical protein [Candidatus Azobacteroides sp.]
MKKLVIWFSFVLVFVSCTKHVEVPKIYYSTDGSAWHNENEMKKNDANLKEMRELQMEMNLSKGISTDYTNKINNVEYESIYKKIDNLRNINKQLNKVQASYLKIDEADTIRAENGMIYFMKKGENDTVILNAVKEFNITLESLNHLDDRIGFRK